MILELKKTDDTLAQFLPEQEPRQGVRYVPSQFAFSFDHGGKQYLYHTLTTQLLEAQAPETVVWSGANEGSTDTETLIRGQFLVPEGKDECGYYNSVSGIMRTLNQRTGNHGFIILPTLRCNARCVYCYEEGRVQRSMTPETVERTLRYIIETHAQEPVWITWFGGEPLLCPDIIDRICGGLREAGIRYRCKIITNGSLLSPAIIEKMAGEWNVKQIQVSMDGAETDYIARKRYLVYHDYFHSVMDSISRTSEAGITVNIRCNVDEENWARVPQFVQDLGKGISHKKNVFLYFALLNDLRATGRAFTMWEKVVEARNLAADVGFRPNTSYSSGMRFRAHFCMVGSGSAVIEPDGSLYPCEHCPPEGCFGNIWDEKPDEARRAEFSREDRTREKCRDCSFLPICTNFASCPTPFSDCRKTRRLFLLDELKWYVEKKTVKKPDASDVEENAESINC